MCKEQFCTQFDIKLVFVSLVSLTVDLVLQLFVSLITVTVTGLLVSSD